MIAAMRHRLVALADLEARRAAVDQKTADLVSYERVKKIIVLTEPFSEKKGELTPTMKLKRKVVNVKYAHLIDSMYRG